VSPDATQQPSGGTHPCPACDSTVAVATVLDDAACPECGTARRVVYALADGTVDRAECEPAYEGTDELVIPDAIRRERADALRDRHDPADEDEREGVYA
jgi:hypothetical protein